jgi:hypothetical protein
MVMCNYCLKNCPGDHALMRHLLVCKKKKADPIFSALQQQHTDPLPPGPPAQPPAPPYHQAQAHIFEDTFPTAPDDDDEDSPVEEESAAAGHHRHLLLEPDDDSSDEEGPRVAAIFAVPNFPDSDDEEEEETYDLIAARASEEEDEASEEDEDQLPYDGISLQGDSDDEAQEPEETNPDHAHVKFILRNIQDQKEKDRKKDGQNISAPYLIGAKILALLSNCPAIPLYMYDELIKLLRNEVRDGERIFQGIPIRKVLEKSLVARYGMKGLYPTVARVPLRETPEGITPPTVEVVTASFSHGLCYLLDYLKTVPPESLLLNVDDPTLPPVKQFGDDTYLGEPNTGKRFNAAYADCHRKHGINSIPLPIAIECDKTHTDATGKLTIEQLRYAVYWLTMAELNGNGAWLGLGMIPSSANIAKGHRDSEKKGIRNQPGHSRRTQSHYGRIQVDCID